MHEDFNDTELMHGNRIHPYKMSEKAAHWWTWSIIIMALLFLILMSC